MGPPQSCKVVPQKCPPRIWVREVRDVRVLFRLLSANSVLSTYENRYYEDGSKKKHGKLMVVW